MMKIVILTIFCGILIGICLSAALAVKVSNSSDVNYCSSCHTLKPMIDSYREDTHGGNNKYGIMAKCSDCHIPQDDPLTHFVVKSIAGTADLYTEYLTDTSQINWSEKRKKREHWVYDSGCLSCHTNLKAVMKLNRKSIMGHKDYFSGTSGMKCVTCHEHVGHLNLSEYLTASAASSTQAPQKKY
jgi:cytochrome c-type protein NapC